MKLFLDDIRNPPDGTWTVVRSYDEFVEVVSNAGVPEVISFDHDLGDGVPTGMDCAKWLVESELPIREFRVHSANPPGRTNITALLDNWKRFCERGATT